jgi:hypothetical protein
MPDLWDTNPDNVFSPPDEPPDPPPSSHDDHANEIKLKDEGGKLRLPTYVLIALGIALRDPAGRPRRNDRARVNP